MVRARAGGYTHRTDTTGRKHMSSERPEENSQPTSGGGLLLRVVVAITVVIGVAVGAVWYANR